MSYGSNILNNYRQLGQYAGRSAGRRSLTPLRLDEPLAFLERHDACSMSPGATGSEERIVFYLAT
jgi:hypothetical protein